MGYSVTFHMGHRVARQHNRRNPKVVDKEHHISKDGYHKTWLDIDPREAYKKVFGQALDEYNQKQIKSGHSERVIDDYYKKIKEDKQRHELYECIISVGNKDNHLSTDETEQILKEFVSTWKKRNPNMVVCGAYFHADEEGSAHVHLDFFSVAHNCTRGLTKQNALEKALNEMGYFSESKTKTAQMQFEQTNRECLENIVKEHGYEVEHPLNEHKKHLDIKEYKQIKRAETLASQNDALTDNINDKISEYNHLIDDIQELKNGCLDMAYDIVNQHEQQLSIGNHREEFIR